MKSDSQISIFLNSYENYTQGCHWNISYVGNLFANLLIEFGV